MIAVLIAWKADLQWTTKSCDIDDLLVRLNTEKGVTLIVVTHNREIASRMGRRIQMVDGKVFEES